MDERAKTPVTSPAIYPLGSVGSRAAARAMLDWKHKTRKRVQYISHIPNGRDDSRVRFGGWREWRDGTLFRYVYVPHVWLNPPIEEIPRCPDCGAAFEKTKEFGRHDRIPAELRGQARSRQPQRFIEGKWLMSSSQQCRPNAMHPSDFPLGSLESRASARMLLEHQRQSANTVYINIGGMNSYPKGTARRDHTAPGGAALWMATVGVAYICRQE
jgi:hypothetical protein